MRRCDRDRLLAGADFQKSQNDYDWLGAGIYFWEYGFDRAARFAREQVSRGRVTNPTVVGALIQLGNCFDLMDTRFTEELSTAYDMLQKAYAEKATPLPTNDGKSPDKKLRRLDCAVLNFYLAWLENEGLHYDSVRCGFVEGQPAFPESGIHEQSHVQISVRNPSCIIGVFRPKLSS